jgi:hypothetical protein
LTSVVLLSGAIPWTAMAAMRMRIQAATIRHGCCALTRAKRAVEDNDAITAAPCLSPDVRHSLPNGPSACAMPVAQASHADGDVPGSWPGSTAGISPVTNQVRHP